MKKLLGISLVAILTAAPMMAGAAVGDVVAGDPGSTASGAAAATNPPKYALKTQATTDGNVATAGYVKGAYNAAIKAVNKLQDTKQDTISDLETIRTNASAGANALQASDITEGTTDGTIKVKGTAVPVHGLGTAAYTASTAYATSAQGTKADTAVQSVVEGDGNGQIKVDGTNVNVHGLGNAAYNGVQGATNTATYTGTDLTTKGYVDEKVATTTSGMVTSAGPGISKSGSKVSVDLTSNGGLETTGSGDAATLGVKVDGTTIEKNSTTGALQVKSGVYATAAQGALAASADQSVAEGSTNGTIKVDGTDVAVHGLGSAAYTASTAYESAGAVNTAIQALDATVTQTAGTDGLALSVTETNGVITAVSGSIADGTYVKPDDLNDYATKQGVVATIKSTPVSSQLNSNAVTGTIATVTDWTNETPGTAALVNGQLTDTTITTTLDPQGTLTYHSASGGTTK